MLHYSPLGIRFERYLAIQYLLWKAPSGSRSNLPEALLAISSQPKPSQRTIRSLALLINAEKAKTDTDQLRINRLVTYTLGRIGAKAHDAIGALRTLPREEEYVEEALIRTSNDIKPLMGRTGIKGWKGVLSQIDSQKISLIDNEKDWAALWEAHSGGTVPQFDFSKGPVFAYFEGNSGKFYTGIKSYSESKASNTLIIDSYSPDFSLPFPHYPYVIVQLPPQKHPLTVKTEETYFLGQKDTVIARFNSK